MSVTIKVRQNGSLLVEGEDVKLIDWNGQEYYVPKKPFALCRCGQSKNKPFCSGAHWYHGFDDERKAVEGEDAWHDVGAFADVPTTGVQEVKAGGVTVALVQQDGHLSALSGTCAHAGGPLGRSRTPGARQGLPPPPRLHTARVRCGREGIGRGKGQGQDPNRRGRHGGLDVRRLSRMSARADV